jgi:hypothetical protein
LDKGKILAISGGILVFVIILTFIFYIYSDFDQQLIGQVEKGVPAEKLIPQIDNETDKLKKNANRHYQSAVINKNLGKGDLANESDYEYYIKRYETELKVISEYDADRKEFAQREITKEQFLQKIKIPKELIENLN